MRCVCWQIGNASAPHQRMEYRMVKFRNGLDDAQEAGSDLGAEDRDPERAGLAAPSAEMQPLCREERGRSLLLRSAEPQPRKSLFRR